MVSYAYNITYLLAFNAPITTATDDHFYLFFFIFFFSKKASLGISCESSAVADDSHEMSRLIFSENVLKKKNRMSSLQFCLGAVRVEVIAHLARRLRMRYPYFRHRLLSVHIFKRLLL